MVLELCKSPWVVLWMLQYIYGGKRDRLCRKKERNESVARQIVPGSGLRIHYNSFTIGLWSAGGRITWLLHSNLSPPAIQ